MTAFVLPFFGAFFGTVFALTGFAVVGYVMQNRRRQQQLDFIRQVLMTAPRQEVENDRTKDIVH